MVRAVEAAVMGHRRTGDDKTGTWKKRAAQDAHTGGAGRAQDRPRALCPELQEGGVCEGHLSRPRESRKGEQDGRTEVGERTRLDRRHAPWLGPVGKIQCPLPNQAMP